MGLGFRVWGCRDNGEENGNYDLGFRLRVQGLILSPSGYSQE